MNSKQIHSKQNPSPRYKELIDMYKYMHINGVKEMDLPPERTFNGIIIKSYAGEIRDLVRATNSKNILDYGCGKADFWNKISSIEFENKAYTVQDFFEINRVTLYDPAYEPYSMVPEGKFDCVICIDVLEHIAKEDMIWSVKNLFHFAKKSLFANIACYSAKKSLPNGENTHCTIENTKWWKNLFSEVANNDIKWKISLEYIENDITKIESFGN